MKLVCLANSWRPGGRCVAGIDLDTGQWVRPVPKNLKSVPDRFVHFGAHTLAPLDVVEVEVTMPQSPTKYQRENRVISSRQWRLIEKLRPAQVLKFCDNSTLVLHGSGKVVEPSVLDALHQAQWKSLELRHLKRVAFAQDKRKPNHWTASFSSGAADYTLNVTCPVATEMLNRGRKLPEECLLTLSLTEPIAYPKFNLPDLCYKLIAAVVPL